jgi:SAM-dependent methyltransferase
MSEDVLEPCRLILRTNETNECPKQHMPPERRIKHVELPEVVPHAAIRAHWEAEACGTRGIDSVERRAFFDQIERERYAQEPFIRDFARFDHSLGCHVLEIGVGAGTDHVQWHRHGVNPVGLDLTHAGASLTTERLQLEGFSPRVLQADAEQLPFPDQSFDIVYAYGVLHHSSNPQRAFSEARRVLKPGGVLRAMIYHRPSIAGFLLALRWLIMPRRATAQHLESPGTHSYTRHGALGLCTGFRNVQLRTVLAGGDLFLVRPSAKYK